jgi:predicted metal-dependent peptidase
MGWSWGDNAVELRERVRRVLAAFMLSDELLFLGLFLKKTWIYEVEGERWYTDGLRIYLGRGVGELDDRQLAALLAHVAMHIALKHPLRARAIAEREGLDPALVNFLADAKANQYLPPRIQLALRGSGAAATPLDVELHLGIRGAEAKSLEELAREARKREPPSRPQPLSDLGAGPAGTGALEVLNEGEEPPSGVLDERGVERLVERKVFAAYWAARSAGAVPGYAERVVGEVARAKVDWRRLLASKLRTLFARDYRPAWTKLNKKLPTLLPGRLYSEGPTVVALLDTSGSISERELQQFVGEVYGIARGARGRLIVIPFDATAYEPIEVRSCSEPIRLRGGGGTMIKDALKAAEKCMAPGAKVVILSDWAIGDLDDPEVRSWLMRNRHRILAVTTFAEPPDFLRSVRIEL